MSHKNAIKNPKENIFHKYFLSITSSKKLRSSSRINIFFAKDFLQKNNSDFGYFKSFLINIFHQKFQVKNEIFKNIFIHDFKKTIQLF